MTQLSRNDESNAPNPDGNGAGPTGTPLSRFAERLGSANTATLRSLCRIPATRNPREREVYLGAWQRAEMLMRSFRPTPVQASALAMVMAAGPELGRRSANDPGDRRVSLLALGVARALLLREVLGERDFLTLTTEWRRITGPNSLR
jgi:hypothetical protein